MIDFTNKFYSFTDTSGQNLGVIFTNIGGAIYKGIEAQATYAFGNGIAVFANGSRNYAKSTVYTDPVTKLVVPRTNIPKAPLSTAAAGLFYRHGPINASVTDKWTGPQYEDLNNYQRIDPYNTLNLAASYTFRQFRVGIDVTDLLDSQKIINLSGGAPATAAGPAINVNTTQVYYQPGRAITGQITFSF